MSFDPEEARMLGLIAENIVTAGEGRTHAVVDLGLLERISDALLRAADEVEALRPKPIAWPADKTPA